MSDEVVFVFGDWQHAIPVEGADALLSYVVEPNLSSQWLHSEIRRMVREGGGTIVLEPQHRDELSRVLEAIDTRTPSERDLLDSLRAV